MTTEERYSEALRAWVAEKGSEGMRARLADGLLEPDEVYAKVRDEIFASLQGFAKFAKMRDVGVRRYLKMADDVPVSHYSEPCQTLSDPEYGVLVAIKRIAPPGAVFEVRRHVATCGHKKIILRTVLVIVSWGGERLTREYQLAEKPWTP